MKKAKAGRKPFIFTPQLIKDIEDMAAQGMTQEQIANNIGICPQTLSTKKGELPELREAITKGNAAGIKKVSNALYNKAIAGDNVAMLFYLKCRAGWSETMNVNHSGGVSLHFDKDDANF